MTSFSTTVTFFLILCWLGAGALGAGLAAAELQWEFPGNGWNKTDRAVFTFIALFGLPALAGCAIFVWTHGGPWRPVAFWRLKEPTR